jgi:Protein of unknown function (DUF3617)
MSGNIRLIAGAMGALGFAAVLALAAPPAAVMEIDLGLWEVSSHPQISGAPAIPESQLAQLSPERRAMLEAALARAAQPRKFKECMTAEKRTQGFGSHDMQRSGCKVTVVTNTSSEYQMHRECTTEKRKTSESGHFKLDGRRRVSGTVDLVRSAEGETTTMHNSIEAKWLSADCGDVKTFQMEK